MKNIHILPTDKPSRLYKNLLTNKLFILENSFMDVSECNREYKNIYITSDEEIKSNRWVLNIVNGFIYKTYNGRSFQEDNENEKWRKIILTTDQDLIKDGVQPIEDEFLEWFVKNPSCEKIEVNLIQTEPLKGFIYNFEYKIIIPKEEPKPHSFCATPEENCTMNYCDENGCQNRKRELVELKQETLEEAVERLGLNESTGTLKKVFYQGAKWKAEKMYSEEEVMEILNGYDNHIQENFDPSKTILSTKEWLEQFKKK